MLKNAILFILTLSITFISHAQDTLNQTIKVSFTGGIGLGGEEIQQPNNIYSSSSDSNRLKAGSGFILSSSLHIPTFQFEAFNMSTIISLGYKADIEGDGAYNSNTFSRLPFEILASFQRQDLSFGLGATLHINPRVEYNDFFSEYGESFDNALGFKINTNYFFTSRKNISIGVEYINIEYKSNLNKYDGSGINLVFTKYL